MSVRLGRSDVFVPPLGLGTAPLGGGLYQGVTEAQAIAAVEYALAHGVNFFDTAPYYDAHEVERRLGLALAGVPRDSYVLATKVGRPGDPHDDNKQDFSRDGVRRSLDGSRQRLGVADFDIVHIHAPEGEDHYRQAIDEAYPLLAELRDAGEIRAISVGENYWEPLLRFAADAAFDAFLLAGRYTLLEQGALPALNQFAQQGISILGAGVYNSGILARGAVDGAWYQYHAAPPEILDRVRHIETVCQRYDVPLNAAALQFVQAHPAVAALVVGAESGEQLAGTIQARQTAIPAAFWADLQADGLIDAAAPVPQA